MRKVFWFILAFVLTISSWFWGSIIWFSCIQFIFMENISAGMILAVWMGILTGILHALCMVAIEIKYGPPVCLVESSHSFEIFEYLMLLFLCGWMGTIYDVLIFGILEIRKFFRQAGEDLDHLMGY